MLPGGPDAVYNAYAYIRVSKDDGDKDESDSIVGQRDLIRAFLKDQAGIRLTGEKVDDGYSGVTFERPGVKELLADIRAGTVNCVVVKDLSRFGRNYIETGRYLEQIFPFMGVRFIAINDGYDSLAANGPSDGIIVPFKNLVNDAYSRDISVKVRSQLEVRRKHGDFVGAFPVYGYFRSEREKGRLVIDELAADIVRDIFKWKIVGFSNQKIAARLNQNGILSPLEYKVSLAWAYSTPFKLGEQAKWSAQSVGRILKNETYTGVMVQGKETTPNYKVSKRVKVPQAEWTRVEDTHEAIISREIFELVDEILKCDARVAPSASRVYPFSGLLRCGCCGCGMSRKKIRSDKKTYIYYICGENKVSGALCGGRRISEKALTDGILALLRSHVSLLWKPDEMLAYIAALPPQTAGIRKIEGQLEARCSELEKYQNLRSSLYEDFKAGILSRQDYHAFKVRYKNICDEIASAISNIEREISDIAANGARHSVWTEAFENKKNIPEPARSCLVTLIERVVVYGPKSIEIRLRYCDPFIGAQHMTETQRR